VKFWFKLIASAIVLVITSQAYASVSCPLYGTTVSSGAYPKWGDTPAEVCRQVIPEVLPDGLVNSGRDYRTTRFVGLTPTTVGNYYCAINVQTVNVETGQVNASESGPRNIEAANASGCVDADLYFDQPRCETCPKRNPSTGDPIYPLTGVNRHEVDLGERIGGQRLSVIYDTRTRLPATGFKQLWLTPATAAFGSLWHSNIHKSAVLSSRLDRPGQGFGSVRLIRAGSLEVASTLGFESCSGDGGGGASTVQYVSITQPGTRISFDGANGRLVDEKLLAEEDYDTWGAVTKVTRAAGSVLAYTYSDATTSAFLAPTSGLLIQVADTFGRTVQFSYEASPVSGQQPRIKSIQLPSQGFVQVGYDASGNLSSLTWPDGKVKTFTYEKSGLPWALTGVVDENNKRHANFDYDSSGRAVSTELAGGVDRYEVVYPQNSVGGWSVTTTSIKDGVCREHRWNAPPQVTMTAPLGGVNELGVVLKQGMVGVTTWSRPAGSGSNASATSQDYDDEGNVVRYDDQNGVRSCFSYDTARKLRTATLTGLSNAAACPTQLAPAGPNQRLLQRQWHLDWELEIKRAEPGRITTNIYNGQPDPFNANTIASCAPTTALLPDGKPIAVLCKQVEQATTDTDGHLGFNAALQSGVANRTTSWTYNQWGQMLTEDGPRTDVNDVTTYTYYSDTSFTGSGAAAEGHFIGDLQSITNAAGKVSSYSKYNKHGQLLESTDANGVLSVNTYDLRQRLLSTTVGVETTSYSYDPVGQLKRVTLPDTSWVGYDYDDAHRQVAVYDNKGNRTEYQLDNAGNRTGETTKDPGGNLKRQLSRSIDALGRVQQTTGRE
jgi:YD repeat-containing protein